MASVIIGGGKLDAAREFADEVARQRQLALQEAEFSQRMSMSSRSGGGGGGATKIVGEFGGEPAHARAQALQVGPNGGPVAGYPYFAPGYSYQASGGGGYSRPAQALPGPYPATGPGEAYDTPYVQKMRGIQGAEADAAYSRERQQAADQLKMDQFEEAKRKAGALEQERAARRKQGDQRIQAAGDSKDLDFVLRERDRLTNMVEVREAFIRQGVANGSLSPSAVDAAYDEIDQMRPELARLEEKLATMKPGLRTKSPAQTSTPPPPPPRSPVQTNWSPELPTSDRRGPVTPPPTQTPNRPMAKAAGESFAAKQGEKSAAERRAEEKLALEVKQYLRSLANDAAREALAKVPKTATPNYANIATSIRLRLMEKGEAEGPELDDAVLHGVMEAKKAQEAGQGAGSTPSAAQGRTVVRTGTTKSGKKVYLYSDGTQEIK